MQENDWKFVTWPSPATYSPAIHPFQRRGREGLDLSQSREEPELYGLQLGPGIRVKVSRLKQQPLNIMIHLIILQFVNIIN